MSRKHLCTSIAITVLFINFWFYPHLTTGVFIPILGTVANGVLLFLLPIILLFFCFFRINIITMFMTAALAILHWILLYMTISIGISILTNVFLFVSLGTGSLYIWLGYLSTHVKENAGLGLRVSWTLQSEEVWKKANFFSGTGLVYIGLITSASSLIVTMLYRSSTFTEWVFIGSLILIFVLFISSLVYAYSIYRKMTH